MKPSNTLRDVVLKVCPDFRAVVGYHKSLTAEGYMPLHVEVIEPNVVSVMHTYRHDSGDTIRDPDVLLFIDPATNDWYPVSIMTIMGVQQVAQVASDYTRIESFRPRGQRDLATFCNQWGRNIKAQGHK